MPSRIQTIEGTCLFLQKWQQDYKSMKFILSLPHPLIRICHKW